MGIQQTSSRRAASLWYPFQFCHFFPFFFTPNYHRLCALHNEVNKRLKKPDFDCAHLSDEYDCGCGDSPSPESSRPNSDSMDLESDYAKDDLTDMEMIRGGR